MCVCLCKGECVCVSLRSHPQTHKWGSTHKARQGHGGERGCDHLVSSEASNYLPKGYVGNIVCVLYSDSFKVAVWRKHCHLLMLLLLKKRNWTFFVQLHHDLKDVFFYLRLFSYTRAHTKTHTDFLGLQHVDRDWTTSPAITGQSALCDLAWKTYLVCKSIQLISILSQPPFKANCWKSAGSFLSLAISAAVWCYKEPPHFFFFTSLTKTLCLPIISTAAHWRSFMLHNLGGGFAHSEPFFFHVPLFFTCLLPHFCQPFIFSPIILVHSHKSSTLIYLSKACRPPSLYLTQYPICLFAFINIFFSLLFRLTVPFFYLFFSLQLSLSLHPELSPCRPPSSPMFSVLEPPLCFLWQLDLAVCAAAQHSLHPWRSSTLASPSIWLLSTVPTSLADSLSGIAHWSATCHPEDAVQGVTVTKCVSVCMWKTCKIEGKLLIHSRHVSLLFCFLLFCL